MPDALARAAEVNAQHLHFLETWSLDVPPFEVAGVNIPRLFTYELIQVLNNGWLAATMEQESHSDNATTEDSL